MTYSPVQSPEIEEALIALEALDSSFIELGKRLGAHEMYLADIFFTACLNRGLQLLHAFLLLVRHEHLLSAAPLLRLQLDNCCRLFAGSLVENLDTLIDALFKGERIDRLRDASGHRMTDAYLVAQLAAKGGISWLPEVYRRTSGYVPFSGVHLHAATRANRESRQLTLGITRSEIGVPLELWLEMVGAFTAATRLLLELGGQWADQKDGYWSAREGDA